MIELASGFEPCAYFPGLVDLCRGDEGKLLYLVSREGTVSAEERAETEKGTVSPPEMNQLPKPIAQALPEVSSVMGWIGKEDNSLYPDLLAYMRRFSYLDELQLSLAAHYAFLTYLHDHPSIGYCPYILFYAVPERGKSRAGKALSYVCFRGFHSVDLREPLLFRFSENLHGTLFLDLMDLWKKAEKSNCQDILLGRFEKGVQCARVLYPDRGAFNDTVYYDIYGPTIIATNEPLHKILGTRCLPITMPNHPGNYENPKPEYALELKARLTAWRAKCLAAALPDLAPIDGISGRLWDISKPLFQIARMIGPENEETVETAVLGIAGEKSAEKRETFEGNLVGIIHDLSEESGLSGLPEWSLRTSEIARKYNVERPAGRPEVTVAWIGIRLTSLSLKKRQVNGRSEYIITQADYRNLLAQYGISQRPKLAIVERPGGNQVSTNPLPENRSYKQQLTGVVGGCRGLHDQGGEKAEEFEERAAIMEHEGGLTREDAEGRAMQSVDAPF